MKKALNDYRVVGLNNNLKFLKRVFSNSIFHKGDYDTGFIEQNIENLLHKDKQIDTYDLVTAVVARIYTNGARLGLPSDLINYKNVRNQIEMESIIVHDTSLAEDLKFEVGVERLNSKKGVVTVQNKPYNY